MPYVFVGAIGLLLGLGAQDIGIQSLDDRTPLRPLNGTCPRCGHQRGWAHVRCQQCGRHLVREPVLALVGVLVALMFARTVGFTWELVPYLAFLGLTLALIVTDLEDFRITDRLNLRGTVVLLVLLTAAATLEGQLDNLLRSLMGAAIYFVGASLLFIAVRGKGFGAGDVKLAVQLGLFTAYLGWSVLGWAVFATALIGGAVAVVMILGGGARRETELPYGPPMILGAWTAIAMVGVGAIPIPS